MKLLFLIVAIAVAFAGCEQRQEQKQILARVGDAVLTLDEARLDVDTTSALYEHQLRMYVTTWIRTEMLYQEAVRRGMENSSAFQRQLHDARKQLAIQQLLEQVAIQDTTGVPAGEFEQYFSRHADEFVVREDGMKLNVIGFSTRARASAFAGQLARGSSWNKALEMLMNDSSAAVEITTAFSNHYFIQRSMVFPELWKVAQTLDVNDVSFPVRTPSGYVIIQLLSTVKKGSTPQYELVQDEVRARYLREKKQLQIDSLIGTLRAQTTVEMLLPTVQETDTIQNEIHD
ncbi:MAG: peptidyl-prolyl cis-trans isomerase [Ignavibacteriae bacterium]|nr:peptidyl-prolyl cis-trans isomerase [Ignavibacteriota bacterium]